MIKAFFYKIFEKSMDENVLDSIKYLSQKYICGCSVKEDLVLWESNMNFIINNKEMFDYMPVDFLIHSSNDLLLEYKIKHYPNKALSDLGNGKLLIACQKGLYKKAIILTFGEILRIACRWDFDTSKNYQNFTNLINEYVYYNKTFAKLYITQKCEKCDEEELLNILDKVGKSIVINREELKQWNKRLKNLDTFKFENLQKLKFSKILSEKTVNKRRVIIKHDDFVNY